MQHSIHYPSRPSFRKATHQLPTIRRDHRTHLLPSPHLSLSRHLPPIPCRPLHSIRVIPRCHPIRLIPRRSSPRRMLHREPPIVLVEPTTTETSAPGGVAVGFRSFACGKRELLGRRGGGGTDSLGGRTSRRRLGRPLGLGAPGSERSKGRRSAVVGGGEGTPGRSRDKITLLASSRKLVRSLSAS